MMMGCHAVSLSVSLFPPGTPVSSTRKLISSSFHRLDMTLAVAEALNSNKPNQFHCGGVPGKTATHNRHTKAYSQSCMRTCILTHNIDIIHT